MIMTSLGAIFPMDFESEHFIAIYAEYAIAVSIPRGSTKCTGFSFAGSSASYPMERRTKGSSTNRSTARRSLENVSRARSLTAYLSQYQYE